MKKTLRKLIYSVTKPERIAVLDYPVQPKPLYTPETQPHKLLNEIISKNDAAYEELIHQSLEYKRAFEKFPVRPSDEKTPAWENSFFPAFDTIMHYTLLAKYKPKKYIEIGSGNSTKLAAFCRTEENLDFTITCFDPHPRREIREIADEWVSLPIQSVPVERFKELQPNDIVFLDGSHVLHANSDVMWFFLEILPVIPKGVLVHIHDIFLPFDYPQWVCDRFFSEQYMFAVCLLNSDHYQVIAPNYYLLTRKIGRATIDELWRMPALQNVKKHGRSFWFTKF
jgi:hypothetical protein